MLVRLVVVLSVVTGTVVVVSGAAQADFTPVSNNTAYFIRGNYWGNFTQCLDVRDANPNNGAAVQTFACQATKPWNQQWFIEKIGPLSGRQSYRIKSRQTGKCLDVTNGAAVDGAPMQMWTCSTGWQQRFWLSDDPSWAYPAIVHIEPVYRPGSGLTGSDNLKPNSSVDDLEGTENSQYNLYQYGPLQSWSLAQV